MATAYLLEKVSWTGMSEFKADITASRTRQLCDVLKVSKDLMANLLLAAGGRGGVGTGGGGYNRIEAAVAECDADHDGRHIRLVC